LFATSQFLSFFSYARCCLDHQTSPPSWSVTSLAVDSSLLQPSIIVDSYPQLSYSSSVLRSLSNAAAAHFCPFLSTPTLKRMNTIPSFQYFLSLASVCFYSLTKSPPAHE
jgi:hypothetical protein